MQANILVTTNTSNYNHLFTISSNAATTNYILQVLTFELSL